MRDIAQQAGVSLGTVSRVLNGKADVNPTLTQRVMRVVQDKGYQPRVNSGITHKNGQRLGPIGMLMDEITYSKRQSTSFQTSLIHGVERRVRERGGHLVIACCEEDARSGVLPAMIEDNLVKSVILRVNRGIPDTWIQEVAQRLPTVMLMHRDLLHSVPSVMCDNYGGMAQVLKHLMDLGHRRIGFYSEDEGARTTPIHTERLLCFERMRGEFGLSTDPRLIKVPRRNAATGESYDQLIERTSRDFLAMDDQRPTAIVCAADTYALCFQRTLSRQGLSLPRDMSLTGFMNTPYCEDATPPLTSVSLNEEELGRAAVDLLEERMRTPDSIVRHALVNTQLIERQSCAPFVPTQ
ncbi:DNA-binding LacI/PurR family transcriptional regulator [Puniceicoccus vermicola]